MNYSIFRKKLLTWVMMLVFTVSSVAVTSAPAFADVNTDDENIVRLAGVNRFETSAIISLFMLEDDEADAIVIVNGMDYPDALAAVPLASSLNAPIMMVNGPAGLFDPSVIKEIDRIDSDHNAHIYIIGGEGAVSADVDEQFESEGYKQITRLAGKNRYETAYKVARAIKGDNSIAFVANGSNYPDALGAGSAASVYGGVLLFASGDKLDPYTREYLEHIGFDSVVILGGEGAVSKAVEDEIRTLNDNVTRVAGKDRYDTGLKIAETYFEKTDMVVIATGTQFADALAGGPFAAQHSAPVLLVNPYADKVDSSVRQYIKDSGAKYVVVLGGTGAVSEDIYEDLKSIVE